MKQSFGAMRDFERLDHRQWVNHYGWICPWRWNTELIEYFLRQHHENVSEYEIRQGDARHSTTLWRRSMINRMPSGEMAQVHLLYVSENNGHVIGGYGISPMHTIIKVNESYLRRLQWGIVIAGILIKSNAQHIAAERPFTVTKFLFHWLTHPPPLDHGSGKGIAKMILMTNLFYWLSYPPPPSLGFGKSIGKMILIDKR